MGSGDAFGMPVCAECLACKKVIKNRKYVRTRASILLDLDKFSVLFDVSPDLKYQLFKNRVNPKNVKYVFVSHYHYDHLYGIVDFCLLNSQSLNFEIYTNKETKKYIEKHFGWLKVNINVLKNFETLDFNYFKITSVPLRHADIEALGFLVEVEDKRIFIAPGFSSIPKKSLDFVKKSMPNIMIIDGQYIYGKYFEDPFHADREYLLKFLDDFKDSKVYFLGISEHWMYLRKVKFKKLKNNWKIALDGMKIRL